MKTIKSNKVLLALSILVSFGSSGVVGAHTYTGSLRKPASATDFFQVTCYDDGAGYADHLVVEVKDELPKANPIINVLLVSEGIAKNATDSSDGDALGSPEINIKGSNGTIYYIFVSKTKAGFENYSLEYHCVSNSNDHVGTSDIVSYQDE